MISTLRFFPIVFVQRKASQRLEFGRGSSQEWSHMREVLILFFRFCFELCLSWATGGSFI